MAYRRAGFLRYAAIQFVALTGCAMAAYAGGTWFDPAAPHYQFSGNFLSDLGRTHALSGRDNYLSSALFFLALATTGVALILFAWSWRDFAFSLGRARISGYASALLGTSSGACFIGVAVTPWDLALAPHNTFVIAAFGLLMLYVAAMTLLMWRNGIGGIRLVANCFYLAVIIGYVALVLRGPSFNSEHGHMIQVLGQKVVAYVSMVHIIYLTTSVRRVFKQSSNGSFANSVRATRE
jgi:hypothetical membrane protein